VFYLGQEEYNIFPVIPSPKLGARLHYANTGFIYQVFARVNYSVGYYLELVFIPPLCWIQEHLHAARKELLAFMGICLQTRQNDLNKGLLIHHGFISTCYMIQYFAMDSNGQITESPCYNIIGDNRPLGQVYSYLVRSLKRARDSAGTHAPFKQ
jgi:hypothetical protein